MAICSPCCKEDLHVVKRCDFGAYAMDLGGSEMALLADDVGGSLGLVPAAFIDELSFDVIRGASY